MPVPDRYNLRKSNEQSEVEKERSFIGSLFQDPQSMQSEVSDTALAYFDLNTRFRELTNSGNETAKQKKSFLKKKAEIEASWHSQTTEKVKELPSSHGSNTSPEYYASFDYSQLETLLKNSDRGGNSDAYNDIVTDLEVLTSKQLSDPYQSYALLSRLSESCEKYTRSKNPWSKTGKIRKAIISQLAKRVSAEMTAHKNHFFETTENSWADYKKDKKTETLNKACQFHFELISAVLQGLITVDEKTRAKYDRQMAELLAEVNKQPISKGQNDTSSTRFFNAIGWTEKAPELVGEDDFKEAVEYSKYKKKMFSCIAQTETVNATARAKQLAGTNPDSPLHYLSDGINGKGTYMAMCRSNTLSADSKASEHSWTSYGTSAGSVQLTMTLNQNARVITEDELSKLVPISGKSNIIKDQFPEVYKWIKSADPIEAGKFGRQNLSMFAALLGYNTIIGRGTPGTKDLTIEYVNTFDRSALTILDEAIVRDGSWVTTPPILKPPVISLR